MVPEQTAACPEDISSHPIFGTWGIRLLVTGLDRLS